MKKCLLLLFCLLAFSSACAEGTVRVEYYFENYCESCAPEKDFEAQFKALTGVDLADCDYFHYNTVTSAGQDALESAMEKYKIEQINLPMAIVNGTVYQGSSSIQSNMALDALEWGNGTDSTLVYLYTPACESCAETESLLASLPESVDIARGSISFASAVNVVHVDVTQHADIARTLFESRNIPDDRRITPAIFLPDRELIGAEAISENLMRYVTLGWAVGKIDLSFDSITEDTGSVSVIGAASAGIIAGLNGCALSMLLLFLTLLLEARRHALPYAIAFLTAKLAAYLMIGFVLIEWLQQFNPSWLIPVSRIVLTVIGAGLILLNLSDAIHAYRGDLGGMKNQLPVSIKKALHSAIRALTGKRLLFAACILLGMIIAAGEFLCAGQLYLAVLLQSVQTSRTHALSLIVYCIAFLLPSCAVTAFVLYCRSTNAAASLFARHIPLVKLLTALAMLALIVISWLI